MPADTVEVFVNRRGKAHSRIRAANGEVRYSSEQADGASSLTNCRRTARRFAERYGMSFKDMTRPAAPKQEKQSKTVR